MLKNMLLYTDIQLLCHDWTQSTPTFVLGESEVPPSSRIPPLIQPSFLEQPELCVFICLRCWFIIVTIFSDELKMQILYIFSYSTSDSNFSHLVYGEIHLPNWFLIEPRKLPGAPVITRWAAFEVWVFSLMLLLNRRQRFFLVLVRVRQNRGWPRILSVYTGLKPVFRRHARRSVRANQFSLALLSKIVPTLLYWFYLFITRALYPFQGFHV